MPSLPGAQAGFGSLKPLMDQIFQEMAARQQMGVQRAPQLQPNQSVPDLDKLQRLMILLRGGQYRNGAPPDAVLGTQ
jgi:hypothetical protein